MNLHLFSITVSHISSINKALTPVLKFKESFLPRYPKMLCHSLIVTDTNGGGWWNDNMEGVDNEEVGCTESWEGVGCTTLGGIEWH